MLHSPLPAWRITRRWGFTLIELLAVVAILGFLIILVMPSFQTVLSKAAQAACLENLRSIGAAAHLYAADNNGLLPGIYYTAPSDGQPENNHSGAQWDVQIMPYLGLGTNVPTTDFKTPFYCPASTRNPTRALSRQQSYAWNSRITDNATYNSKRLANLQQASTTILALDNKYQGDQPDQNGVTFGSAGNTIYINENASQLKRVAYERHNGRANILFADGSAASRPPVNATNNPTPQGVRFYNNGPLSR